MSEPLPNAHSLERSGEVGNKEEGEKRKQRAGDYKKNRECCSGEIECW